MTALLVSLTRLRTPRLFRKNNGIGAAEVVAEATTKTTMATAKEGVNTNSATIIHGKSEEVDREDAVASGKNATIGSSGNLVVKVAR